MEVSIEVYEYLDRADHKTENLAHEQRRHWKTEFLKNASAAFDDKRAEALKAELLASQKQEDVLYRKTAV